MQALHNIFNIFINNIDRNIYELLRFHMYPYP